MEFRTQVEAVAFARNTEKFFIVMGRRQGRWHKHREVEVIVVS